MDAFEKARHTYEKNRAARERSAANKGETLLDPDTPFHCEVPSEKPQEIQKSADAVITVTVSLPNGEISFSLKKKDVLHNVPIHRLTKHEFKKAVVDGLKPLLGSVSDLP